MSVEGRPLCMGKIPFVFFSLDFSNFFWLGSLIVAQHRVPSSSTDGSKTICSHYSLPSWVLGQSRKLVKQEEKTGRSTQLSDVSTLKPLLDLCLLLWHQERPNSRKVVINQFTFPHHLPFLADAAGERTNRPSSSYHHILSRFAKIWDRFCLDSHRKRITFGACRSLADILSLLY